MTEARRYLGLLALRPFNILVAAEQLSAVGDAITTLALPILVFGLTGSPVAAGVAVAARSLPWIFAGPAVAIWTDRASRQAIMVACDLGRGVLVASLLLAGQVPVIVAIALATGTLSAVQRAARTSLIPSLVAADDYPAAASLQRTLLVAGTAAGSAVGGALIAAVGPRLGFAVDAATFGTSAALVLSARVPASAARGGGGGGVLEGWRQVFGRPRLAYTLLTAAVASALFGSAPLLATRATAVLHADASAAGDLLAVASVGLGAGSIAMGASAALRRRFPPAAGVAGLALAYAAMALVPRLDVALATWFAAGAGLGANLVYLNVMIVRRVPSPALGRAAALVNAVGYGSLVVGPSLTGQLQAWLGARYAPLGLALCGALAVPLAALLGRVRQSGERGGDRDGPLDRQEARPQAAEGIGPSP